MSSRRSARGRSTARAFTLDDGDRPAVLISAGIGATPLLAMLHELHETGSTREVWWFHGARTRAEHAFAGEAQSLVDELAHARHRIWYSRPGPTDRVGVDYDENGRITAEALRAGRRSARWRVLHVRAGPVHECVARRPRRLGVPPGHVHTEIFGAQGSLTPGVVAAPERRATSTRRPVAHGTAGLVRAIRAERALGDEFASILELAEHATFRCDGRVAPVCATPARAAFSTGPSSTRPTARAPADGTCSCVARARRPISRSICRRATQGPALPC